MTDEQAQTADVINDHMIMHIDDNEKRYAVFQLARDLANDFKQYDPSFDVQAFLDRAGAI